MNQLEQLRRMTVVVADTGNFGELQAYAPRDATTNPSLILRAVQLPEYRPLLDRIVRDRRSAGATDANVAAILDEVLIAFGREILAVIPGRVSTETDARLSFDTAAIVAKSRELIGLYEAAGVPRPRSSDRRFDRSNSASSVA